MAGKPNRDRGRRTERAHPHPPREASVERVDAHTLIVRSPVEVDEILSTTIVGVMRAYVEQRADADALRPKAGVWLTPGEVTALEAGTDVTDP